MWYIVGFSVLLVVSAFTGIMKNKGFIGSKSGVVDSLLLRSLSRTQVNILLARLENEKPPASTMGAMCYSPVMNPTSADYICPVCGEKTVYDFNHSAFIDWELPGCRRFVESINGNTEFDVQLDETQYCDFCSPDSSSDNLSLLLEVTHENGETVVNAVTVTDLRMLDSFLEGNLYYSTSNDGQYPLQEYSERIRTLLGLD